ncbi:isoprenylcysteine carboxylmethyltransferase family protein [Telluribacter sp. SYSU D00476]|uniref:methyltransferase family protein n=1 Tax=Telluribacter sp. SYSU D00476 TaxID=2811430 RepID=UPI001FF28FE7|nr:isoprenylcysteine carboxylmethyltransferase family protein [Telluribacter sp. SYSU D00476]
MTPYLFIVAAWLVFGVLHSLMASKRVKEWVRLKMVSFYHYYRLLYNLLALLTFGLVLGAHRSAPAEYLWVPYGWMSYLGATVILLGLVVIGMAVRQYDLSEFTGLDVFRKSHASSASSLIRSGILRYVRHPLYSGTILISIGLFLFTPTISNSLLALFTMLYIRIGIYFEEKKLIDTYGETYQHYQRQVPMLWPLPRRS